MLHFAFQVACFKFKSFCAPLLFRLRFFFPSWLSFCPSRISFLPVRVSLPLSSAPLRPLLNILNRRL